MAQDSYGSGTAGSGGFVPPSPATRRGSGNAGFALSVTHGLGGAQTILAISTQPASLLAGGTQVLVEPRARGPRADLEPDSLGRRRSRRRRNRIARNPAGVPRRSRDGGDDGLRTGRIADYVTPTTFAATAGLRVTLTMPPLFAMTTTGAANTSTRFLDAVTMTEAFPAHHTAPMPPRGWPSRMGDATCSSPVRLGIASIGSTSGGSPPASSVFYNFARTVLRHHGRPRP